MGFFDESETTLGGNGIFMKKIEEEEDWCFKSLSLEKDKDIDESSVEMAEDVLSGHFLQRKILGFCQLEAWNYTLKIFQIKKWMRNLVRGIVGAWHLEVGDNLDDDFVSSFSGWI